MFCNPIEYDKGANVQKSVAWDLVRDLLAKYHASKETLLLDMGCGTGFVARAFGELSPCQSSAVYQIDSSREMCEFARRYSDYTFNCSIGELGSKFPKSKFDVCISSMCFQWLNPRGDQLGALAEAVRTAMFLTRKGGVVAYAAPLPESLHEVSSSFTRVGLMSPIMPFFEHSVQRVRTYTEEISGGVLEVLRGLKSIGATYADPDRQMTHAQLKLAERYFSSHYRQITWRIGFNILLNK